MENLEEMDKFLSQEEIENMNKLPELKLTVIWKLSTSKSPGPDSFIGKFYQTFREES